MFGIGKMMLRPTSVLQKVYLINVTRQSLLPFSTSVQHHADATATPTPTPSASSSTGDDDGPSYDSMPVHLSSAGKLVMVLGGLRRRISDVPDTISNRLYQKTKDKFRARCIVASMIGMAILAFTASMRGKAARREGKRYTDNVYNMHRGESRLHEQLEQSTAYKQRKSTDRYSPLDEINK